MVTLNPIYKVYITFDGDLAAGIFPERFEAEVFIDPKCVSSPDLWLEEIRAGFEKLYYVIGGAKPQVMFDFELQKIIDSIPED